MIKWETYETRYGIENWSNIMVFMERLDKYI